jgi:hypothetical protein
MIKDDVMSKIIVYHGSLQEVQFPEIKIGKYNKDFYFGFYVTLFEDQAKRWATRLNGKGIVSAYQYTPNHDLKILKFPTMTEEWLDFTDDAISREAFWALAKFKKPTHQMSFHTARALTTLSFLKGTIVYEEK